MALYTLCIGIERNDQSELLWTAYIPILRQHYVQTAVEFEQVEIVDQALMLLPLSKSVWDEVKVFFSIVRIVKLACICAL